ncbi:MAG: hypothetical protein JJU08_16020 [Rhodobacteraceae bacterium]|nr:hypothetical protein [Paracoccaceae bacterium]
MAAEQINAFPAGVADKVGYYVYRLIDPRNGETFYVGKGAGNRVFDHANGAVSSDGSDEDDGDHTDPHSAKLDRIQDIRNAGLGVLYVIHRHELSRETVFEVEAAVMDCFPGLSNIQGGHGSATKGPMSVYEIIDKYALPEVEYEPAESLVLINVNGIQDQSTPEAIYHRTRFSWRIDVSKAKRAQYVLAVVRGVVKGAFIADTWLNATYTNFPEHLAEGQAVEGRKGFIGREAPSHIWDKFVGTRGKRITNPAMKHVQFPIRYWSGRD